MPADRQKELAAEAMRATAHMKMLPLEGPQTEAYCSKADILLYGGQAGGGKTILELGWGINEAESGIIFRRERTQTDGLEKEGKKLIGSEASYNGQDLEWTWPSGKTLKLAGMKQADDWISHAGRERDYMGFDEGGEFLEIQVASIIAWLRAPPGKRTRIIIGSNPPRSSDGMWLRKWFAPWLEAGFGKPAVPGELRWAVRTFKNEEINIVWVDGPGEHTIGGETYTAQSYTFIPAKLEDNPYRNTPEYRAQLQSLPEPLRSQLLYGDFDAGLEDSANQVIPSAWIWAAQNRWLPSPPKDIPMCAMGVDASGGGKDPMMIACRHDGWYAPLIEVPAKELPIERMGAHSAGIVMSYRQDEADVIVDMGGGYGGPIYEHLHKNRIIPIAFKGAETTDERTHDRRLGFFNRITAAYWKFREALDPGQANGSPIALPNDPKLVAELTARTFEVGSRGIKMNSKEDATDDLGHSPDRADAVVMAWYAGLKGPQIAGGWKEHSRSRNPKVITQRTKRGR